VQSVREADNFSAICETIEYIFVELQLGFNPVAVVQQYSRQVTHITHKHNTKTQQ
jgi:hypothetical protein